MKENIHETRFERMRKAYPEVSSRDEFISVNIMVRQSRQSGVTRNNHKQAQADQFKTFIAAMEKSETVTVFDESYWESLMDYVTITKENTVVFTIKNGQKIEIER